MDSFRQHIDEAISKFNTLPLDQRRDFQARCRAARRQLARFNYGVEGCFVGLFHKDIYRVGEKWVRIRCSGTVN
jgi:hypothetical protein